MSGTSVADPRIKKSDLLRVAGDFVDDLFRDPNSASTNNRLPFAMNKFWGDESGAVLSAEFVVVVTICVFGVIVGLSHTVMAINEELSDLAQSIGALDQTFSFTGYTCCTVNGAPMSATPGSTFADDLDECDCSTSCDLLEPPPEPPPIFTPPPRP